MSGLVCYLPVEFLIVGVRTEIFGISLLPVGDLTIPTDAPVLRLGQPIGCVAAVEVDGIDHQAMAREARAIAGQALRLLRTALREHRDISESQLRFKLGDSYAFSDGAGGWSARPDVAHDLGLGPELVELALSRPIASVPWSTTTDINRKADTSMRWMERATFIDEPIVALLYLFFALEALLGDKAGKLKGAALAFRRAMLSHVVTGGFSDPGKTFFLYEVVRSAAVHGEATPEVTRETVESFAWSVRTALDEYLTFAQSSGFQRRSRLVHALETHPDLPDLIRWLEQGGGSAWQPYLKSMDERDVQ